MEKERQVKPDEPVEVEWVKSPFHKTGSKSTIHAVQAKKLIDSGRAKVPGTKTKGDDK